LSTWCLIPKNLNHPLWNASTVREQIYVRAFTATEARMIAASLTAGPLVHLPRLPISPWLDASLATSIRSHAAFADIEVRAVIDAITGQVQPLPQEALFPIAASVGELQK
jgi:hypothetical protein